MTDAAGGNGAAVGMGKPRPGLLVVLKGYPRVSETFIAQELLGLQEAGLSFEIVSLRRPYDAFHHPVHEQIKAKVLYLPERLREEPARVAKSLARVALTTGFWRAIWRFLADFARDQTSLRVRCLGQAVVLAAERAGKPLWLYSHFAHTPTSVARYAAMILDAPYSISAHAKDIWTSPDWDLREKLNSARWSVTCTQVGLDHLVAIAPGAAVHLCYHGLDLDRFPSIDRKRSARDGSDRKNPVRILSVGRAVPKKGYDTLLRALSQLPDNVHWCFDHIGGGTELEDLKALAAELGIGERANWRGARDQTEVLEAYRKSDLFVLASRETTDSDRDGLPNVLVEAASQGLACVATRFSAIPELIEEGTSGLLVPPEDHDGLAEALNRAITAPALRDRLGRAAEQRVREEFDFRPGIAKLKQLFETEWVESDQRP